MLSKLQRADKKTVERIFKQGKFLKSQNLLLRFIPGDRPAKISFIVPKSTARSALVRNGLRRRGYAALERCLNKTKTGFSGAFVFGRNSVKNFSGRKKKDFNPFVNLEKELVTLLQTANK